MKTRLLTWTRVLTAQWHFDQGHERFTLTDEALENLRGDEGIWLQVTCAPSCKPPTAPPALLSELRRWRRFLREHKLPDAQLHYQRRVVRLAGPPPHQVMLPPEWSLYLTIPTRRHGSRIVSHGVRAGRLNSRRLMTRIQRLMSAPVNPNPGPPPGPLLLSGDLLPRFLGKALGDVLHDERLGKLVDMAPAHPIPKDMAQHLDQLLPRNQRFVPHQIQPAPPDAYQVVAYEADKKLLLLERAGQMYSARLPRSLYRYRRKLRFTSTARPILVKDSAYILHDAFIDAAALED